MTAGPEPYRQWWGYVRTNSEIVLREYRHGDEIRAACDQLGIAHVRGPFIAIKAAALGMLKGKLAVAKSQASMKRLLASSPQKLLTHDAK
jgi:hypothetical protein